MVKKRILNTLIKAHQPTLLEKHLIHSFLETNGLTRSKSQLLAYYFRDFTENTEISAGVASLKISSMKDLENGLELIIPAGDRKLNGAFFTPGFIIDFIIKEIHPEKNHTNFDPSCGSGAFLVGLTEYYARTFGQSVRKTVRENIFGSDILEYNIRRTKLILALYALQQGEILKNEDFNLWNRDSLRTHWKRSFDQILSNPPYVKFQDLSGENRKYLARRWETVERGSFNLYFAFFELGLQMLKPKGKLVFITPNNYFTSVSGESLRKYFHRNKCVYRIIDFSHRRIFEARTYTSVTFLNKEQNDSISFDRITEEESPESFLKKTHGSPNLLKDLRVKKWRLLKMGERENIRIIENIGIPIGELFEISTGIATLKDQIYFLDGNCEKGGYYMKETSHGSFRIEKSITRPVYKISDFKNQEEAEQNTRRIICPYHVGNGSAKPIPEEEFKMQFPECYRYFLSEKKNLLSRDKGKIKYDPFFVWGRTQGLTRFGKRILTPTFSQYPRFLMTGREHSYFTNGYSISPKEEKNPDPSTGNVNGWLGRTENMDIVQTVLNSVVMHYYISKTSVIIDGGYPCYQKNFIEKFSIPRFADPELVFLRSIRDPLEIDEFLIGQYHLNLSLANPF
jgi:adenine-specific DNA-methyltransferase